MKAIQDLLNRIRWDKEYAKADFKIGYYDRVEKKVIFVPFRELYFDDEDHFDFQVLDDEGETHSIPLHRVREVYKNGKRIWHRDVIEK